MKCLVIIHKDRMPSRGASVMTECGETLIFDDAREGDRSETDCPHCKEGVRQEQKDTKRHGVAIPHEDCEVFVYER